MGIINETLKAIVAMYNAEQLTTQREEVSLRIKRDLMERAEEFHIDIQDCAITHLEFSKEFAKAVEDKQIAQQDAEQAKYKVELAVQEKQSKIIDNFALLFLHSQLNLILCLFRILLC